MTEADELREQLQFVIAERNRLHAALTDHRLDVLEKNDVDKEKRLRLVEVVATKFNFVMSLSIGGGALSLLVLVRELMGA